MPRPGRRSIPGPSCLVLPRILFLPGNRRYPRGAAGHRQIPHRARHSPTPGHRRGTGWQVCALERGAAMTIRDAKEILLLYRPGRGDESDPQIAEALDLARREPELQRWLEENSAFHEAMAGRLKSLPVPR